MLCVDYENEIYMLTECSACRQALAGLEAGNEALDAVETSIITLEDEPSLNAGTLARSEITIQC